MAKNIKNLLKDITTEYLGKIGGRNVMITKQKGKFRVFIEGEALDIFSSLADAKKAANEFIKLAGGSK